MYHICCNFKLKKVIFHGFLVLYCTNNISNCTVPAIFLFTVPIYFILYSTDNILLCTVPLYFILYCTDNILLCTVPIYSILYCTDTILLYLYIPYCTVPTIFRNVLYRQYSILYWKDNIPYIMSRSYPVL